MKEECGERVSRLLSLLPMIADDRGSRWKKQYSEEGEYKHLKCELRFLWHHSGYVALRSFTYQDTNNQINLKSLFVEFQSKTTRSVYRIFSLRNWIVFTSTWCLNRNFLPFITCCCECMRSHYGLDTSLDLCFETESHVYDVLKRSMD